MSGTPSARSRLRPLELIGISAIIAVFIGGVVVLGTREWLTGLEWSGVAFVVALVVTAMLLLAVAPKDEQPDAERRGHDGSDSDSRSGSGDEPRGH